MTIDPALLAWADKVIILAQAIFIFLLARGQRAATFPVAPSGPVPPAPVPAPIPVPGPPVPSPSPVPEPSKPVPAPARVPAPIPAPVGPSKVLRGKCSYFGGPKDTGVAADEGLALIERSDFGHGQFGGLFLPTQPEGTTGLARALNPDAHYIACRWDYSETSRKYLQGINVTVKNPVDGKVASDVRPVDWGPNAKTGRVADLSPGLMAFLGLNTDDTVEVDIPLPSLGPTQPPGPVTPSAPTQSAPVSGYPVPSGENHLKVLTNAQCNELFGQFTYTNGANGDIHIDPAWVAKNIVTVEVPQLAKFKVRNVQCHRLVAPWLVKAFAEIEAAGLLGTILSYDGLWVPRHINHNASLGLSRHSDGAALDINANWNAYGTLGAKRGAIGSTWEIEPIFAANGFACGRWFGWPNLPSSDTDGMHFEWVGPPK
jgi:hypothetical protein